MSATVCAFLVWCALADAAIEVCKGEGPRYGDFKCNHDQTHRVCAKLKDDSGKKIDWANGKNFWQTTGQPDWSNQVGADARNPGGNWCICMWATARLISAVGCDHVHIDCAATDLAFVEGRYSDGGVSLAPAKECLIKKCGKSAAATSNEWTPSKLHSQYSAIFKTGNRNAASHLWFSFVSQHSKTMSQDTFLQVSASFCAISGSPVSPASSRIYKTSLPLVTGGGSVS